jgi:hypothetical protein
VEPEALLERRAAILLPVRRHPPKNREAIAKYERSAKEAHDVGLSEKKALKKIQKLDGENLFKSIYGREL